MTREHDAGAVNRFGSWYKNDSWADITVCFKVRNNCRLAAITKITSTYSGTNSHASTRSIFSVSPTCSLASLPSESPGATGNPELLATSREGTPATGCPSVGCYEEGDAPKFKRARTEYESPPQQRIQVAESLKHVWAADVVEEFPAHRLVLGSMSDVFKVQFDNWDRQLGARVSIMLESCEDLEAAHELVRFMYFEQLSVPLDALTLIKVARLADQYQVLTCLNACSNALCGLLSGITPSSPSNNASLSSPKATATTTTTSALSDPNAELLLATIMLEEHVGTPLTQLQQKAVDILRTWFRDFDAAWNRDVLRALFLQLPWSYLFRLLLPISSIMVVSENSIATALHYWAQAQPPGALTPELSTSLLRLLHFLGLSNSYLSVLLPILPSFSMSPDLARYLGEACRLKMSEAFRKGHDSIERSSRDRRETRESKENLQLKVEDWQHIVGRPLGLPTHFARRRSGSSAYTAKSPWQYTWTVTYGQLQALVAAASGNGASSSGAKRGRGLELCSPPKWFQGLMFTTKLQVVAPSDKARSGNSPVGEGGASTSSATRQGSITVERAGTVGERAGAAGGDRAGWIGEREGAGMAGERGGERAGDVGSGVQHGREREAGGETTRAARSASPSSGAQPNQVQSAKLQCAVCVQVDPRFAGTLSEAGVQFHMSYNFKVGLPQSGDGKIEISKTHTGALMPLDGSPLWKPLWRVTPAAVFDSAKASAELTVVTQVLDVN